MLGTQIIDITPDKNQALTLVGLAYCIFYILYVN